jgi:hypothetical protein
MKRFAAICILLFLSSACLKKIEEIDTMTTNIYDTAYTGDSWFFIDDAYEYMNGLGENKVKLVCVVPASATPDLKPSFFKVIANINADSLGIVSTDKEFDESYEFWLDTDPSTDNNYCITLSVFIEEDSSSINPFTECIGL